MLTIGSSSPVFPSLRVIGSTGFDDSRGSLSWAVAIPGKVPANPAEATHPSEVAMNFRLVS